MKINAIILSLALLTIGAVANAQSSGKNCRPQCTPEPISMVGLGIAGMGLLRARFKKTA